MGTTEVSAAAVGAETYPVTAGELFARLAASRRALHPVRGLRRLFPAVVRRDGGGGRETRWADLESILDAVAELEAEGRVETWAEAPRGPVVLLSALSAEQLGLELNGKGVRWRPAGVGRRGPRVKRRQQIRAEVLAGLDLDDPAVFSEVRVPAVAREAAAEDGCGPARLALWFAAVRDDRRCWGNGERLEYEKGLTPQEGVRWYPSAGPRPWVREETA